jgi:chromosome segregation ATPase
MCKSLAGALAAVLLFATIPSAFAQQAPDKQASREREMLRRAQAAQKQAEDAKAVLEQEKTKLDAEAKAAKAQAAKTAGAVARERKRADDLQVSFDAVTKERSGLQKDKEALGVRLADTEARLKETLTELARTRTSLAEREKELAGVQQIAAQQARSIRVCEDKNLKLYGVAIEVIGKHRDQGVWDAVKRKEPFTGLRQVEVENLLEEYRDRASEARVEVPCRQ